jgi:ABC-type dipeptide/oligopeptide/nickel transport system permease component
MVVWKHALRNALIQPLTVAALLLAGFLDGSVLVETVFAWPGLGQLAVQAVSTTDFPVLSGAVLFFAAIFLFMNVLADITYALIDPRIRYQ